MHRKKMNKFKFPTLKPGMRSMRKPGSGGSRRMGTPTMGNILTGRRNNRKKM